MEASKAGESSEKDQVEISENNVTLQTPSIPVVSSSVTEQKPIRLRPEKMSKRRKMNWTPELHQAFLDAVAFLGGPTKATTYRIKKQMNVEGLSALDVSEHLRSYRRGLSGRGTVSGKRSGTSNEQKVFDEMPQALSEAEAEAGTVGATQISDAHQVFHELPQSPQGLAGARAAFVAPHISAADHVFDEVPDPQGSAGVGTSGAPQIYDLHRLFDEIPQGSAGVGTSGAPQIYDQLFDEMSWGAWLSLELGVSDQEVISFPFFGLPDQSQTYDIMPNAVNDVGVMEGMSGSMNLQPNESPEQCDKLEDEIMETMNDGSYEDTAGASINQFCSETLEPGDFKPELDEVGKEERMMGFTQTQLESSVPIVEDPTVKHPGHERGGDQGVSEQQGEIMFSKLLTPTDIGEVNHTLVSDNCVASTLLNISLSTPLRSALPSTVSVQDVSQPFSCNLHPLEPALGFDGKMVHDALLFCALFPSDHEFDKDSLVQLWIADGIFVKEPMERIAGLFFEDCLTKKYFQFSGTNVVTGKAMYKLKVESSLVTSLMSRGSHVARIEDNPNLDDISQEVSHLSIRCHNMKDSTTFSGFKKIEQLRTLIFLQGHESSFKQVSRNFFLSLRLMRVLDLSKTRLMELPSSIGNMKCLCYLDLSDTLIKALPEVINRLENLQTLKLRGCSNLTTLPKGMRKLVNLRHLDFDVLRQLWSMPPGMGALTNIQTLSAYLVGAEEGCGIRQLKNMNNLSGSLCISRLENILAKDEAEEACLSNKSQLEKLELHWSDSQLEDNLSYEEVLSSLQPNLSLKKIRLSCYGGFQLPSWICDPAFSKLVSITLFKCQNCQFLSSLGQLPSLKLLNIVDFHKLKVINQNFYGGSGLAVYIAFPKLEKLTVENMLSLEEWSGFRIFDFPRLLKLTVKNCPKLHSLCSLSCLHSLEYLEISHCPELASCPDVRVPARLETFIIKNCPLISARFLNDGGHDWLKVAHIPHVWIDHQEMSFGQRFSQGDVDEILP